MVLLAMFLYLIRILAIGVATGCAFIKFDLFPKMSVGETMTIGICASPMFVSLMNYLLGLIFIGWPSWFFYVVPLAIAIGWIMYQRNYDIFLFIIKDGISYAKKEIDSLGKWIYIDIALGLAVLTLFVARFDGCGLEILNIGQIASKYPLLLKMLKFDAIVFGGICISFASRWFMDKKRREFIFRHYFFVVILIVIGSTLFFSGVHNRRPVFDTDFSHYELNTRYFMADKNSWNIDNYTDERDGSSLRDDHGPLWIMALADPRIACDVVGLDRSPRVSNFNFVLIYSCFSILLFLTVSHIANKKEAGLVTLLLFGFYLEEKALILCWRDAFRFIGLLLLYLYVGNIFFSITEKKMKWQHYAFLSLFCYLSMNGHASNVYVMLGMFLLFVAMLFVFQSPRKEIFRSGIAALFGTVCGITKNISIYLATGRLASSTEVVFHDTPVEIVLRQRYVVHGTWAKIWGTYSYPVLVMMALGSIGLLYILVVAWRKKQHQLFVWGVLILGMLLPLSGMMDWIGYECSRWFFYQGRYRMYFLMILAIAGSLMMFYPWRKQAIKGFCAVMSVIVFLCWGYVECGKFEKYSRVDVVSVPRNVGTLKAIADKVDELTNGDTFVDAQLLLYYLHGNPKLLFHIYSESLIQAKTEQEIKQALHSLRVGAIILPPGGSKYSLLPFWDYINEEFICISSTEFGKYVIFLNPEFIKEGAF